MKLPIHNLPATIKDVATAMENINNCPPEMSVPVILTLMSYAVQGRFEVDTRHFGRRPVSIYALVLAHSGQLKSEIFNLLASGGVRFEKDQMPDYQEKWAAYEGKLAVWKDQQKDALKEHDPKIKARRIRDCELAKPLPPKGVKRIYESPSSAGLMNSLQANHHSAIIMSPEAGTFIGGHGLKSPEVRQQFIGNLNKLWNAETVERVTGDVEQRLLSRRMSMLLMTQEETILGFVNDPLVEGMGLTARFLLSQPPKYSLPRVSLADEEYKAAKKAADRVFSQFSDKLYRHLDDGLEYDEFDRLVLNSIAADEEAFVIYDQFQMVEAAGYAKNKHPFFAKYLEHTLRIAAVMAAFDGRSKITAEYMNSAIHLMRYFADQWLKIDTSAALESKESRVIQDILKWAAKQNRTTFTANDLNAIRSYKSGLNGSEKANLRHELVAGGYCESQSVIRGNNAVEEFKILG